MNATHPRHFVRHATEVILVLAKVIDELSKEDEEDLHGGAMHHRTGTPAVMSSLSRRFVKLKSLWNATLCSGVPVWHQSVAHDP
jgi:hypothetical protein